MSQNNQLRPIGTTFEQRYNAADGTDTSIHDTVLTYQIVAHVKVARYYGDKDGEPAEELKCIASRTELPKNIRIV